MLWREDLAAQALKLEKERQESSQELLGMYSSTQLEDVMPGKDKIIFYRELQDLLITDVKSLVSFKKIINLFEYALPSKIH